MVNHNPFLKLFKKVGLPCKCFTIIERTFSELFLMGFMSRYTFRIRNQS